VDISDEKTLRLTAKATVMNDLVDVSGIEARLITGFPHVRFIGVPDPLTGGVSIDQFLQSLMSSGTPAQYATPGAMSQNAARASDAAYGEAAFTPFDPSGLEGIQAEDLFFYRQPGVTLKNGERGYYVLFQAESPYTHVYRLDIPDTAASFSREASLSPQQAPPLDVWHTLKFTNTAKMPLTTAAAITVQDGQMLGQDMLDYTSPGAEASLKITKALEVHAEDQEEETARERGAVRRGDTFLYDLVTVQGTIAVTNRKPKDVQMKVTKVTLGEAVEASAGGKTTKSPVGLRSINPMSRIVWEPLLKPGESLRLTYTYKVYVASY